MSIEYIHEKILDLATREQLVEMVKELLKELKINEKMISEFKDWRIRAGQYEEFQISKTQAIVIKDRTKNFYYCPVCFENKKVISLQPYGAFNKQCPDCKATYEFKVTSDFSQSELSYDPLEG